MLQEAPASQDETQAETSQQEASPPNPTLPALSACLTLMLLLVVSSRFLKNLVFDFITKAHQGPRRVEGVRCTVYGGG